MALISQDDIRLYANIGLVSGSVSGSTEASGVLQFLIDGCSAQAESYVGHPFATASYTVVTDGDGSRSWVPENRPLVGITSLTVGDQIVTESVSGSAGYHLDGSIVRLRSMRFTPGHDNVGVTYVAGYPEVPADVRLAVLKWVATEYFNRLAGPGGPQPGEPRGYPVSMPQAVKEALDPYRRIS
jgi:hypothetical protein